MGERIRAFDWGRHPLGPPQGWPASLRMAISLCLNANFPTAVYWGPELFVLYNDAWSVIPAERHPAILGMPAREAWTDIWHIVGPQFEAVLDTGNGIALYDQMLPMVRGGRPTETWWNYSFTAIRDAGHQVAGVFNQGHEVTELVLARRQREVELQRWRGYLRQAPAGVALLRGPEHVFEFANHSYLHLVGGRDIVGRPVVEALPEIAAQGFVQLLDGVYRTGEPYVGSNVPVKLERQRGTTEDRVVDFVYEPLRDPQGHVDGIFVLVTDATERARAEAALRISNWQLGEERARLAAVIEAEQRAQQALRRFNEGLEANVRRRTRELTEALEQQSAISSRMRATFATDLLFQGYLDREGTLLDANPVSLAAIGCELADVAGRPFWDTRWFQETPGMPQRIRDAVAQVRRGSTVRDELDVQLQGRLRRFRFSLRPVFDDERRLIGMVPEALELAAAPAPATP